MISLAGFIENGVSVLGDSTKISQYSPNSLQDGSIVSFVSESGRTTHVLKRRRNRPSESDRSEVKLLTAAAFAASPGTQCLVVPSYISIDGVAFQYQPFVKGYSLARSARRPFGVSARRALEIGLSLCDALASLEVSANPDYPSHRRVGGASEILSGLPSTILHNDLGPANILLQGRDAFLIDWDDMDFGPSVFNFLEYVFHYSSIYGAGRFRRRTLDSYRGAFSAYLYGARLQALRPQVSESLRDAAGELSTAHLKEVLHEFLRYKRAATGGYLDQLWHELWTYRSELASDFRQLIQT